MMFYKIFFQILLILIGCSIADIASTIIQTEQLQSHPSADFIKLINLHPNRLIQIEERIRQLRKEIKKLDEDVNKVQETVDAHTGLLNGINTKLTGIDTKLNQILTNTKPKSSSLTDLREHFVRNRRTAPNSRISVGRRSIASDEYNHDEYTNEFTSNDAWNEPAQSNSEFKRNVFDWQNRTDQRLNKIMNVLTEIYREDKQLSLDLSSLNMKQTNENQTDTFDRIKKEFKEQFSYRNAELKGFISSVDQNCLRLKTQNDNLSFLLLNIKDNLTNPQQGNKLAHQENSVLAAEEESRLVDTSSLMGKNELLFCKSIGNLVNNTIELLRTDLSNVKQQILNKFDRENTRINERIFTLNNNYQYLNNLRNCNFSALTPRSQTIEPQQSDQQSSKSERENEIDSQSNRSHKSKTTIAPLDHTMSSTFVPPFHPLPRKRDDDRESRSKSNTRTKLINPIKYGQIRRRGCHVPDIISPASCEELYSNRVNCDGVYVILLQEEAIRVYCEMDENAGSTVIMRRGQFHDNPLTSFNQDWNNFKKGFGSIDADFWLGLDKIHELTRNKNQMLVIDLETFGGDQMTLKYNNFYIDNEMNNFKLTISDPDPENAIHANLFLQHNGASFYTKDRTNRFNCPRKYEAGWWYFDNNHCLSVLLNGVYYKDSVPMLKDGIQWPNKWPKQYLKAVQMKIRERK